MQHSARIKQRRVVQVGMQSQQANASIQMGLAAMQCKRLGHKRGIARTVGAYRRKVYVCPRCFRVISEDGTPPDVPNESAPPEVLSEQVGD